MKKLISILSMFTSFSLIGSTSINIQSCSSKKNEEVYKGSTFNLALSNFISQFAKENNCDESNVSSLSIYGYSLFTVSSLEDRDYKNCKTMSELIAVFSNLSTNDYYTPLYTQEINECAIILIPNVKLDDNGVVIKDQDIKNQQIFKLTFKVINSKSVELITTQI